MIVPFNEKAENSVIKMILRKKSNLTLAQAKILLAKCMDDVSRIEKYKKVMTPIGVAEDSIVDIFGGGHNDPYDPDYILRFEAYVFPDQSDYDGERLRLWRECFLNVMDRMMVEMKEEVALLSYESKIFPVVRVANQKGVKND